MIKKQIVLGIILMVGIIILPMKTKAVLQANPNTHGKSLKGATQWMTEIRAMESKNQAMGLEEIVDSVTQTTTNGSNNIDVHMIKSTEYGTMAILSASGYGNSKKIQDSAIKSTTGNKSGVYVVLDDWEWTAGVLEDALGQIDSRYYDAYTTDSENVKIGDALGSGDNKNPRMFKMA